MGTFNFIGITGNCQQHDVVRTINKIVHLLKIFKKNYVLDESFNLDSHPRASLEQICQDCDILFVIGGDGSFLKAARQAVFHQIPLLGFNRGRLGFLTDIAPQHLAENLTQIFIDNSYKVEKRHFLELRSAVDQRMIALNDMVITHESQKRMIEYTISSGSNFICHQRGDGVIFSTPTGSTAYSLSASGPIVTPELPVNLIVPMFSHTLSMRPLVISNTEELDIFCYSSSDENLRIIADGQDLLMAGSPNHIKIKTLENKITLIHPIRYNFYRTLRKKLGWAKGFDDGSIKR